MPEISFRKEALERLTSPDQLDERVLLAPQRGWLALMGITILVAFGIVWSIFAEIPVKIRAPGVFLLSGPAFAMSAPVHTKLSEWLIKDGDQITKGQLLARFENPELEAQLKLEKETLEDLKTQYQAWHHIQAIANRRWKKALEASARELKSALARVSATDSPSELERARYELEKTDYELKKIESDSKSSTSRIDRQLAINESQRRIQFLETKLKTVTELIADRDGIVLQIQAYPPARVESGQTLVTVSPSGDPKKDLLGYAFVRPHDAPAVEPGQKVEIHVANFNAEQTGLLIGKVQSISRTSLSASAINSIVPVSGLAKQITESVSVSPHMVVIELDKDEASPTGYHWSGFDPQRPLTPGNSFTSTIILKVIHPIAYLWRNFNRFI